MITHKVEVVVRYRGQSVSDMIDSDTSSLICIISTVCCPAVDTTDDCEVYVRIP